MIPRVNNFATLPIPQWQKDELARWKRAYLRHPESGQPWPQVKQAC